MTLTAIDSKNRASYHQIKETINTLNSEISSNNFNTAMKTYALTIAKFFSVIFSAAGVLSLVDGGFSSTFSFLSKAIFIAIVGASPWHIANVAKTSIENNTAVKQKELINKVNSLFNSYSPETRAACHIQLPCINRGSITPIEIDSLEEFLIVANAPAPIIEPAHIPETPISSSTNRETDTDDLMQQVEIDTLDIFLIVANAPASIIEPAHIPETPISSLTNRETDTDDLMPQENTTPWYKQTFSYFLSYIPSFTS